MTRAHKSIPDCCPASHTVSSAFSDCIPRFQVHHLSVTTQCSFVVDPVLSFPIQPSYPPLFSVPFWTLLPFLTTVTAVYACSHSSRATLGPSDVRITCKRICGEWPAQLFQNFPQLPQSLQQKLASLTQNLQQKPSPDNRACRQGIICLFGSSNYWANLCSQPGKHVCSDDIIAVSAVTFAVYPDN